MAGAYYNENDPKAAAWLRELIKRGLIAPGDVNERSILDVRPEDLSGYVQCHFFAGIGVWSYALRCAGWPDDRPVWTGSCPCPPFSAAGKKKACPNCGGTNPVPHVGRTGFFVCCLCGHEWFADERHLWPEMWRLLRDGRPDSFFGEQVAGKDGNIWLVLVRASLQILGYRVGGGSFCACSVGAPHIRQRIYFVGQLGDTSGVGLPGSDGRRTRALVENGFEARLVADAEDADGRGARNAGDSGRRIAEAGGRGVVCPRCSGRRWELPTFSSNFAVACPRCGGRGRILGDALLPRLEGHAGNGAGSVRQVGEISEPDRSTCKTDVPNLMVNPDPERRDGERLYVRPRGPQQNQAEVTGRGPVNGFWSDALWIPCRDEKMRPVEPGTFPLAHGAAARVVRLRGYGNSLVAPQAEAFVRAYMDLERTG